MSKPGLADAEAFLEQRALPARGGHRLFQARRWIDEGGVSVVSFDVFDTLLWRRVPRPTDAFTLLGEQLGGDGELLPWVDPAAFRRLRIAAEQRARSRKRQAGNGVEVSLEEIWSEIPNAVLYDTDPGRMADFEFRLERRITQPDLDVVDLANFAAERGCQLVVISNTYFSNDRLARLLARPGLEVFHKAILFASSSFGVGKADGLWDVVLRELGVVAGRIVHVGDDANADVEVPKEHGIRTIHHRRIAPETAEVLAREGALPPEPRPASPLVVDWPEGDFGLTGVRAKVASRVEATDLTRDFAVAWHYGAGVLGPVLTGFAEWVHRRTLEVGARTAWCMMREGEFLGDLVQAVADHRGEGVRAEQLWLSRLVTGRACLDRVDEASLRRLLVRRLPPTVGQFVAQLGLSSGEMPDLAVPPSTLMEDPDVVDAVILKLVTNDFAVARIVAEASQARQRLVRYLRATLGDPVDPVVLVDLGWAGTIQHQLTKVLQMAGFSARLVGLYLATNTTSCDRILDNREISGYLTNVGEPAQDSDEITRSPEVVEQACLATIGSVVDFDDRGHPVLDGSVPSPEQVISKLLVQRGVRAFQSEWLRYDGSVAGWPQFDGRERPYLRNVLRTSVSAPTRDEARVLGAWMHEDNFGDDGRDRIIPERTAKFVPHLSPPDLIEMDMSDAFWPLGLAAEYDPGLAQGARMLQARLLDPDTFEMGLRPVRVSMFADTPTTAGVRHERRLRVNHNGLSYARFDLRQPGATKLRFGPCDHPAIFRLDLIELAIRLRGTRTPQRVRIQQEDEFAGLVYSGCRWLYEGVALSFSADPHVHIPLASAASGEVEAVTIEVAFAVLEIPAPPGPIGLPGADLNHRLTRVVARTRAEAGEGGLRALGRGAWRQARRAFRA